MTSQFNNIQFVSTSPFTLMEPYDSDDFLGGTRTKPTIQVEQALPAPDFCLDNPTGHGFIRPSRYGWARRRNHSLSLTVGSAGRDIQYDSKCSNAAEPGSRLYSGATPHGGNWHYRSPSHRTCRLPGTQLVIALARGQTHEPEALEPRELIQPQAVLHRLSERPVRHGLRPGQTSGRDRARDSQADFRTDPARQRVTPPDA